MVHFDPAKSTVCGAADLMPLMVCVVDAEGRFRYVNRVCAGYFGLAEAEFVCKRLTDVVRLQDGCLGNGLLRGAIDDCIATGSDLEAEAHVRRSDGEVRRLAIMLLGDARFGVCYMFLTEIGASGSSVEQLERGLLRKLATRN